MKKQHIHPTEAIKDEWLVGHQQSRSGNFVVQHSMQTADELELLPSTHHCLALNLNNYSPRQVSRFDTQEYDGPQQRGDFWLLPAGLPSSFAWDSTDETIMFILEPTYLNQIATETECLSPSRVELLPIVYQHDFHLEAIAQQLNISQYHFCDLFKQSMKIAPYQYVMQQRIERAKQLLGRHREMAIVDIALRCGFANQPHFHRHFRKYTGITPKAYRKQCRILI